MRVSAGMLQEETGRTKRSFYLEGLGGLQGQVEGGGKPGA